MFTVCLYVIEKDSNNDVSERFANVLVGLPHGLIHLTGDYPCTEYRSVAMPFHLVFLILGMCCTGTFTGIFAGGFVEYLGAQRAMERHEAKEERLRVMAMAVCVLQRRFRARRRRLEAAQPEPPQQVSMAKAARRRLAARLLRRQTSLGRVFMALAQAALVINICNTMLESIPEIEAMGVEARSSLTLVEIVTGTIFVIEFLLHFISKPTGVFTTPMRFIDFVCLFPTFLRIYFQTKSLKDQLDSPGMEAFIECVAACRVVRVLDWPQIRREVLAVKQTLKAALPSLAMPAVISLQLWVLTAGIFVWLENMYHEHDQPSDQDQMQSIPDALYWCSIYLLGEWAAWSVACDISPERVPERAIETSLSSSHGTREGALSGDPKGLGLPCDRVASEHTDLDPSKGQFLVCAIYSETTAVLRSSPWEKRNEHTHSIEKTAVSAAMHGPQLRLLSSLLASFLA
ncbi:unnamed protein product [Durusdinium trenchii]|uniref:Ion transport domain-containing protein n=2 Tax=Durusdinium trenchii TaxID=1381693 RepID=A0ABP0JE35_9DINO